MTRHPFGRAAILLLLTSAACADGGGAIPLEDAGETFDSGAKHDAGRRERDASVDAAPRIPAVHAQLFAAAYFEQESMYAGFGNTLDLGAFSSITSSLKVTSGYVAYGFSETNLGGTISPMYEGEIDWIGDAENDKWKSVAVRDAADPYVTVFSAVGGQPHRYPVGRFPSLGAYDNTIDGFSIPAGVTIVAYRNVGFDQQIGVFAGPLDTASLPERDSWSSMDVRFTTPEDALVQASAVYIAGSYGGESLVLNPGLYPNISLINNAFRNTISSTRTSEEQAVWGFRYEQFGGPVFGPYSGDSPAVVAGNDDWVSIMILPRSTPTVTLYLNPDMTEPYTYPVGRYTDLRDHSNKFDGVDIPAGVRICGWSYPNFQQTKWELVGPLRRNLYSYGNDDWDSMVITTNPNCN